MINCICSGRTGNHGPFCDTTLTACNLVPRLTMHIAAMQLVLNQLRFTTEGMMSGGDAKMILKHNAIDCFLGLLLHKNGNTTRN